ncbi:MAG: acyltransferase family protein [Bradymonadaceae bacterium]
MNPDKPLSTSQKKSHYRSDIQGMRGIAVLLVVLSHAGILFSGGFIGVDVFFVLSGFVIAQVLLRELEDTGRVNLRLFYEKRFRRLLPAAAAVSVFTLIAIAVLLSPTGAQQISIRTGMAASIFISNIYLYRGGGYFDPSTERNPFLHMWSLSVEEQFYFVLPLTMALVWGLVVRHRKKVNSAMEPISAVMAVVAIGGALSFLLSLMLVTHPSAFPFDPDRFGFFFPLTRIWEFAAGVLLALSAKHLPPLGERIALWWGGAGLAFILYAAYLYDGETAFPGWAALLPVMGTVLLLVAGDKSDIISRGLSWKPLTWLGNISYSWYLWHWPLIVLVPVVLPDAGWWLLPLVGFGSLLPAWVSYRYLEEPIRRNRALVGRRAQGLAAGCIATVFVLGLGLSYGASKEWGLDIPAGWSDIPIAHQMPCDGLEARWSEQDCTFLASNTGEPSDKAPILLLGDSHAASLSDGVIAAAHELGYDVVVRWMPRCPFLRDRSIFGYRQCGEWQRWMMGYIEEERPSLVITTAYANNYVLSPHYSSHRSVETADGTPPRNHDEALASWGEALENTLQHLDELGVPTIVAGPVPYYAMDFTLMISPLRPELELPTFTREAVEERQRAVGSENRRVLSRFSNALLFDPVYHLCGDELCSPVVDGTWLYMDHTHLNAAGGMRLAPALQEAMREVLELSP